MMHGRDYLHLNSMVGKVQFFSQSPSAATTERIIVRNIRSRMVLMWGQYFWEMSVSSSGLWVAVDSSDDVSGNSAVLKTKRKISVIFAINSIIE